jgi:hypothetical protein
MEDEFVVNLKNKAQNLGMTQRQLTAACIAIGYQCICNNRDAPISLPSEPSPFSVDE